MFFPGIRLSYQILNDLLSLGEFQIHSPKMLFQRL